METRDSWEAFDERLDNLPIGDASSERIERIRVRCLAALAERRRPCQAAPRPRALWREWLEPALVAGLSAFYLAAAVGASLRLAEVIRVAHALMR